MPCVLTVVTSWVVNTVGSCVVQVVGSVEGIVVVGGSVRTSNNTVLKVSFDKVYTKFVGVLVMVAYRWSILESTMES